MKKCPYCAEEIQDEAIFCRYCRRELPGLESGTPPKELDQSSSSGSNNAPQVEKRSRKRPVLLQAAIVSLIPTLLYAVIIYPLGITGCINNPDCASVFVAGSADPGNQITEMWIVSTIVAALISWMVLILLVVAWRRLAKPHFFIMVSLVAVSFYLFSNYQQSDLTLIRKDVVNTEKSNTEQSSSNTSIPSCRCEELALSTWQYEYTDVGLEVCFSGQVARVKCDYPFGEFPCLINFVRKGETVNDFNPWGRGTPTSHIRVIESKCPGCKDVSSWLKPGVYIEFRGRIYSDEEVIPAGQEPDFEASGIAVDQKGDISRCLPD